MSVLAVVGQDGSYPAYENVAAAASAYLRLEGAAQAEIVFCDEQEIRTLNRETRGVDRVTDVLSFPALTLHAGEYAPFTQAQYPWDTDPESGRVHIGCIVICTSVAATQAVEYGHSIEREQGYLFLHGLLHLLGYDHMQEEERIEMRKAEEAILAEVGLVRD